MWLSQDIWHNFHGGVGKAFVSSSVAELAMMIEGPNLDSRIEVFEKHYEEWRVQSNGTRLHFNRVNRETFGITSLQVTPSAAWNKFGDTQIFMSVLEDFLRSDKYNATEISADIMSATSAANRCFSRLYRSGLWLTSAEARFIGHAGLAFLQLFARLANETRLQGRLRFPVTPKVHYLHHAFLGLFLDSQRQRWLLSPLAMSVQLDEDMIGRVARWSRRVGYYKNMRRTVDRYKVAAWLAMQAEVDATSSEVR